jgi:thiol:disulfide interchange protein DsbD
MTAKHPFHRLLIAALFVAASTCSTWVNAQNSIKSVVTTEQVRAELMAHAPEGLSPGKAVWIGLQLKHQPQWHTYWKNSGDSGQPTVLKWTLPVGVLAGDLAWPLPQKILIGNLANYGYGDTVLLPVPLTITPEFKPLPGSADLEVKLQASWLVCKQECVPQEGEFGVRLPIQGSTALNTAAFEAAFKAQPQPLAGSSQIGIEGRQLKLSVTGLPATLQGQQIEFFPETPELIETAAQWTQGWQGAVWTASLPIATYRGTSPETLPLLLVAGTSDQRIGISSTAKITGNWPPQSPTGAGSTGSTLTSPAVNVAPVLPAEVPSSLWLALLGALLGGMILNLMPCVFPVLAIKVVGFARLSTDQGRQRIGGLAYSAGVVLSFLALGALMLVLRGAGEQLGWGFQLQSPAVVAVLAALFTVLGLNLAGLFEFGQLVPSSLASIEAKNPSVDAFLSGVLAVVIASPCTAPFMGASLGLALSLPALQALSIFAAIGSGMALPYLAASWSPGLARKLPRPGAWMNTFRHAMAFPMFATVVWLVWVLGQQSGIDGAAALLALLLGLALVIWTLGLVGRGSRVITAISIAILALLTGAIGKNITHPSEPTGGVASTALWQAWAPDKVTQLVASGSPVFVDFTAAWCVTCQYNKKTTLANAEVLAAFAAKKVSLLRADWTRRDPAITTALAQLGRNGVPVYVLHAPGRAPQIFSEVLSASALKEALAAL